MCRSGDQTPSSCRNFQSDLGVRTICATVACMSDQALIAELERQREPARKCFAHYEQQEQLGVLLERPNPGLPEITRPLIAALTTHPVFGRGRNIFFASKQLNLHPQFVPHGLLRMTLDSDASSAVAWLHRLFTIDRADVRMVAAVHGIEVQQPLSLSNRVSLLPLAAAPDSPNLRMLARRYQGYPWSMIDVASAMLPVIAIFDLGSCMASSDWDADKMVHDSAYAAILDAVRAFTLTDSGAPVVGNSWTDFVDPTLTIAEFGRVWMVARFEGSPSQAPPVKVDTEAIAWAERYFQMSGSLRRSIDVALDRLNLARRRRTPGDQAIDSGICLEALLGDESPQELAYKLRLRAALLLGTTLDERKKIRQVVRDLYELRSKVVHGRARWPTDAVSDAQCAARGLEICTQALRAIVRRNEQPDFAAWELMGGPLDAPDAG